jgi:uncharacterized protein with FMN-binding domain
MKKVALSLFVIGASGAYVWSQSGGPVPGDLRDSAIGNGGIQTSTPVKLPASSDDSPTAIPTPMPADSQDVPAASYSTPAIGASSNMPKAAPATPAQPAAAVPVEPAVPLPARLTQAPVEIPLPRPRPAHKEQFASQLVTGAAMSVPVSASYADGTYVGPVVDAYYGPIQIQAVIQNGRLASVQVLQYPADRRTSISINRQALPMLRDEVVSAQSARVDIISGATLTSEAFLRSLEGALKQARS